jgi:hypothetical protein
MIYKGRPHILGTFIDLWLHGCDSQKIESEARGARVIKSGNIETGCSIWRLKLTRSDAGLTSTCE